MLRNLLLAASLVAIPFLLVPAASATAPVSCQVVVWDWWEHVHCGTGNTFVNSDETWCPNSPDVQCLYWNVLDCSGPVLTPCTIL
ncbi:MAG: hypothetical protein QOE90_3128 [Thermoplasmata archaeon]|jgi:hypothetical protein|nr:hypothetical protein [Thermoplasmata archaeon]